MPQSLSDLAGFLLVDEPVGVAIRRILDLALACLPPCDGAGIAMARDGGCAALVDNNQIAARTAALQYATGEAPCAEALLTDRLQVIDSTAHDSRWTRFSQLAREQGILSCLALPLRVRNRPFAAISLYSRPASAFVFLDPATAGAVMVEASMALANAVAHEDSQRLERLARLVQTSGDLVA